MENIQAHTANTLSIPVKQPSGNMDPIRQNQQVPAQDTYINQETSRPVQKAFDVQISREARNRMDAAASNRAQYIDTQATLPPETQPAAQLYSKRGSVVDILA